jgi:hypothetical protein
MKELRRAVGAATHEESRGFGGADLTADRFHWLPLGGRGNEK